MGGIISNITDFLHDDLGLPDPLHLFDKPAALPVPGALPRMPTPNDENVRAARRRSVLESSRRRGRTSTILSQGPPTGDTLG